jgi:hypothetical protein
MLQSKAAGLTAEKAVREERIMVIGQQITALWKRLSTSEEEQTAFLESHAGIGDDVIAACEDYLATKQGEFAARLVDLIGGARATISGLWAELRWGGEAQTGAAFPLFSAGADAFTDDLFLAHEAYIATATAALEEARPLLKHVEKREAILGERAEYEALMADPQRLLIKGSSAARLREEKLERRVKKELPAVTKRLRQQCVEWEAAHGGTPFIVDGARYIDVIDAEDVAEAKAKDEARHRRENRAAGTADENSNAGAGSSSSGSHHVPAAPVPPPTTGASAGLGSTRSTSAPTARPSVYRPAILNATGAAAAAATGAVAKPRLPGLKKSSVPATSSVASSSSSSSSSLNDDMCTVVSGASASEPSVAPTAAVAAPKAAAAPAPKAATAAAPLGTINANKARAPAPAAAGSKSVVGKTIEAHVSGEAEKAASVILSAL